jgi:hypothetical protein
VTASALIDGHSLVLVHRHLRQSLHLLETSAGATTRTQDGSSIEERIERLLLATTAATAHSTRG